jgi:hypothetical protein
VDDGVQDVPREQGLGDDVYGYKLLSNGAAVGAPAGNPDQVLPWINVDEMVLKYASAPTGSGVPTTGNVTVVGQHAVHGHGGEPGGGRPDGVRADARQAAGRRQPATGVAPTPARTATTSRSAWPAAGAGGSNLSLRMNVLQGDTDHTGETGGQHSVLAADFSAVKKKFFKDTTSPVTGTDVDYSVFHDVNGSGSILANDFSE